MNAASPPHSLKMRLGAAERSMPAACIDVYATLAIAATTERCDVSTIPYHTSWPRNHQPSLACKGSSMQWRSIRSNFLIKIDILLSEGRS